MGKVENDIYCRLTAGISTKVLQKYSLSNPLWNIQILSKPLNLISCHDNWKAKFAKKYSKIISSEAIRGMKLKLCRNVHNIMLYISCVFYFRRSCAFVAMATSHWLIMGKVKIGVYWSLIADILTKVFQKCSLSSRLLSSPPLTIKKL